MKDYKHKELILLMVMAILLSVGLFLNAAKMQNKIQKEEIVQYDASMEDSKLKSDKKIYNKNENKKVYQRKSEQALEGAIENIESMDLNKVEKICEAIKRDDGNAFYSLVNHIYLNTLGYQFKKNGFAYFKETLQLHGKIEFFPISCKEYDEYSICQGYVAQRKQFQGKEYGLNFKNAKQVSFTLFENGSMLPFVVREIRNSYAMLKKNETKSTANPDLLDGAPLIEGIDDVDDIK